jgi:leucyl/phenylalanyl-tRNA--protein transferase
MARPRATRLRSAARPYLAAGIGRLSQATAVAGTRVGSGAFAPTASEVLANFPLGWLLFGVPESRLPSLEWRRYPERAVITPATGKIPRRLRQALRRQELQVRFDADFEAVIAGCRDGRSGWLTPEAVEVYRRVHALGFIATVGTYRDGRLVGGLWGIALGRTLGMMSMFHTEANAGSLALGALIGELRDGGRWGLLDAGEVKPHATMYGAVGIGVDQFSELVWTNARGPLHGAGEVGT